MRSAKLSALRFQDRGCMRNPFTRLAVAVPIAVVMLHAPFYATAEAPGEPIVLPRGPHLFIDDHLIAQQSNLTRRTVRQMRLTHPVITAAQDKNFQPYVSVVRDGQTGRFRAWYGVPADAPKSSPSHLAYIESEDGIRWNRPHRVLADPGGIEVRFGASVFDEGPGFSDPAARFKFAWYTGEMTDLPTGGLMVATSPDGLAWTPVTPKAPVLPHTHDINNVFRDPIRNRYVATISMLVAQPDWKTKRRLPMQSVSTDLVNWSEPFLVLAPDGKDEGETQFYAMSGYLARGELLIGLVKVLRDDLPADPGGEVNGIGYTTLAWSRDGRTWQRDREPFFDRDPSPGTWDHAMAWIDCQLPVGDEVYLYYGGYARGHKVERFAERQIGLARMPRDRYVARVAGAADAVLL